MLAGVWLCEAKKWRRTGIENFMKPNSYRAFLVADPQAAENRAAVFAGFRRFRGLGAGSPVALAGLLLMIGCAQLNLPSAPWSRTQREAPGPNTLAGRVAAVRAAEARIAKMDARELEQTANRFAADLNPQANTPIPVKIAVVATAPKLPPRSALPLLQVALHDPAAAVRAEACRSIAGVESPEATELLISSLSTEEDTDVRLAAARALGSFHDPRVIEPLGSLLDDRDPAVQYIAMQSLEQVTGEDGGQDVRQWKQLLEQPGTLTASQPAKKYFR